MIERSCVPDSSFFQPKNEGGYDIAITKESFGTTADGVRVFLYTIRNGNGMEVSVTDYGANIVKILAPDRFGRFADVVLGYDTVAGYEKNTPGYGSFIGRHANRIGGASVVLDGRRYELEKNDGANNLHSGSRGFNKFVYQTVLADNGDSGSVEFSRVSPDMEQGLPGNMDVAVRYTLTENNELILEYSAAADKETVINLTNHSYFNLAGHASGDILGHKVIVHADSFTPTSDDLIPTGEIRDVTGTPMDFREFKEVGKEIDADYIPLRQAGGYDHNYCLNKTGDGLIPAAELWEEESGRYMQVYRDLPGMQLYTGNFIKGDETGKDGCCYQRRGGICFETQYYPNACNIPAFPSDIFKAGENYHSVTVYKFGIRR